VRGLPSLIRLHKRKLEEQQRELMELESVKQGFVGQVHALDAEIAEEGQKCTESPDAAHVIGSFVQACMKRRSRLEDSIHSVQVRIDGVREHVADAFQELKRFELALEMNLARQRKAARRREQILEDEMGINMFRRQQK